MKRTSIVLLAVAAAVSFLPVTSCKGQAQTTVYFLAAGPRISQPQDSPSAAEYESFIVPVNDPNQIASIRSLIQRAQYPVVNVRIKAGGDGINRDFYTPGAPAWNWSVVALLSVQGEPFIPPQSPPEERYGSASMIAADPNGWIARHGDQLAEQWFPLTTEVNPFKTPVPPDPESPVMANLSTRAFTGNAQEILVGGTSISGTRPKQVAVRASGNSLLGRYGIGTRVGPHVRVFKSDGTELAVVYNLRRYELASRFPDLAAKELSPNFDTLAIITLYPGQYTFHVFDPFGNTGIVLFELYDLALAPQPFP
jgi:hypothetical protein